MCGIFGYLLAADGARPLPSLGAAVKDLRHRGPDAEGTFRDSRGKVECGLAHTRLAIIDLSPGGKQPMSILEGKLTIVFNGEIYNYRDVRAELEGCGDQFVTGSDTEVILRAYARWGSECLRRFRGMFAFVIWNAEDASLFLARDPMGVKPLYLARVGEGLLFSSEVRALLASGWVPRKLDANALSGYLAFGSVREPRSIVRNVEMLPPGSFGELRDGRWRQETYWVPPLRIDRTIRRADAVAEIRSLLRESVALRLVSDVPVGVFLSGGMDSSAIVALASQLSARPVHTFTVTFDEAGYDEAKYAREVAASFGAEHHVVHLSSERALDEIDDALAALDQPSADGTNTYFVARAVREAGLAVALSGIGGDELFAGYAYFRQFRTLMQGRPLLERIPIALADWVATERLSNRTLKAVSLLATRGNPFEVYAILRAVFLARHRKALLARCEDVGAEPQRFDEAVSEWASTPDGDAIAAFGLLDSRNYLRNTLLRDTDVMGMASALEVREPLLDHRLAERLFTLPGSMRIARGTNKPLLSAAVPELPTGAVQRPKMGFTLPLASWLRGPLRDWGERNLLAGGDVGLDLAEVRRIWRAFQDRRLGFSQVWTLLALITWCRRQRLSL